MQTEYSAIKITIPKIKVSLLQRNTFLYEIDVATRWNKWHLQKKYPEFQQLHKQLSQHFNDLPEFPGSLINSLLGETQDDIEQYKELLEIYLQQTSLRNDIINCDYYAQFLQLRKYSNEVLVEAIKFDGEAEVGDRENDDGKIIVAMHYTDDYIVLATGNNSGLEKFNAVIANTKFPWEDEEEGEFILPLGTVEYWSCKKKPYGFKKLWARNYPQETTSFLFNIAAELMVVGLADGSLEFFKLIYRGNNIYYQLLRMINPHNDVVSGLHLDPVNRIMYSSSISGFLAMNEVRNGALLDSVQFGSQIVSICGDEENMRLFISEAQGSINIVAYNSHAKVKVMKTLSPPEYGAMKTLIYDKVKSYLFAGSYDSGSIYVFEVGKPGHEKITKQIAMLKNKQNIMSMHYIPSKMELIVGTEGGQVFFWNCLEGKQIYMLRAVQGEKQLATTYFSQKDSLLVTFQKEKMIKFWKKPAQWRDVSVKLEQERQIEIRKKVENLHKVREAIRKKEEDSDQDDLACWFATESSDDEDEDWLDFII